MTAARYSNVAIEKLVELRYMILEHILKISVMPKHLAVKHWKKELNAYVIRLKRYNKGKNGKENFSKELLKE